jgi:hypothetical protein
MNDRAPASGLAGAATALQYLLVAHGAILLALVAKGVKEDASVLLVWQGPISAALWGSLVSGMGRIIYVVCGEHPRQLRSVSLATVSVCLLLSIYFVGVLASYLSTRLGDAFLGVVWPFS